MPDPPAVPTRSHASSHQHQNETVHRRWCLQAAVATTVVAAITTAIATSVDPSCHDRSLPHGIHSR
jgi:hypothetical protein